MRTKSLPANTSIRIPDRLRPSLVPVAQRVFWWGNPEEWLNYPTRFVAQVMTFGDWDDTGLVWKLLGESVFLQVLVDPPPGVFDIKSWSYWHHRFQLPVPPLPCRKL
jgi:hypothetical protein